MQRFGFHKAHSAKKWLFLLAKQLFFAKSQRVLPLKRTSEKRGTFGFSFTFCKLKKDSVECVTRARPFISQALRNLDYVLCQVAVEVASYEATTYRSLYKSVSSSVLKNTATTQNYYFHFIQNNSYKRPLMIRKPATDISFASSFAIQFGEFMNIDKAHFCQYIRSVI